MKAVVTICRWAVGLLFIFSGLIKANDPLGLSYKMLEFFEAWHWSIFNDYALVLSLLMNLLEVVAGVALIVGWSSKFVTRLLLLLIVFFTFLTSYVLFSGKIKACGCFGDCVPLTPIQTFTKDIILLVMIVVLCLKHNSIKKYFSTTVSIVIVAISFVLVTVLQWYVLRHLPILDCLPYAKGKNIVEGMKVPAGAIPDSTVITFKYTKAGKTVEFDSDHFPADFDDSYVYVDRYDKLIRKGNATPAIVDFNLVTLTGTDTTQAILATDKYVLLFIKEFSDYKKWQAQVTKANAEIKKAGIPLFIATADAETAANIFSDITILKCDATVIKTAARVTPTYFVMKAANVTSKFGYADADELLQFLK